MLSLRHNVKATVSAPSLTSLFDVVVAKLKSMNQKTFLTRIVYAVRGEIRADDLIDELTSDIHSLGELGPLGLVTGVQLAFEHHSIVMIEGPESTLLKHLGIYVNLEENEGVQLKTKILVSVDYIHQRFFNKWDYIRVPNQAWGEEKSSHQENNSEVDHVKKCVDLFLTFCEHLHQNTLGTLKGTSLDIAHKVSPPMLTPQMLDSVLDSSVLPDIADLIQSYQQIPQTLLWRDNMQPLTSELVPEFILRGDICNAS
nr:PREDICTED: uncharacterized protein LOC109036846 [Bemisia tabaci]